PGSETAGRTEAEAITPEADGQHDAALTADKDTEADAQVTQADSAVEGTDETSAAAPPNPFPSRYDVDEIVALATDPRTIYVYWELRPVRFAQAHHVDPQGQLVVRTLTVVSGALDIATDSRDIPVDQLVGDRFIRGLLPGAELRLCLGWNGPGGFVPLAVAEALQMPRDHQAPSRAVTADGHDGLTARRTPDEPAAGPRAADPRGGTASATASSRLRSYQAQLARQPSSGTTGSSPSLAALDPGAAPVVVHFAKTRASASHEPLGGASDLMSTEGRSAALNDVLGGASDLYGGASDLFGGPSDFGKNFWSLYPGLAARPENPFDGVSSSTIDARHSLWLAGQRCRASQKGFRDFSAGSRSWRGAPMRNGEPPSVPSPEATSWRPVPRPGRYSRGCPDRLSASRSGPTLPRPVGYMTR
ncbi:MAG: hypothetical protein DRI90_28815, partial [Deltaproteobacteria bacterium]